MNTATDPGRALPRRKFLMTSGAACVAAVAGSPCWLSAVSASRGWERVGGPKLKLSLNAYSFNQPLLKGSMSLDQLLEFCAREQLDAVDITGYYFPGYPQVPSEAVINSVKRRASILGLDISGTGVRNDFTQEDPNKRKQDVQLVKEWVRAAARLGAPTLRIFAGQAVSAPAQRPAALERLVDCLEECVPVAEAHGVILAIQNHNDFITTAAECHEILQKMNSSWLGIMLDTGSFRQGDPYQEIASVAPLAVNWQIKEEAYVDGKPAPIDLARLIGIIKEASYRGYLPIETLGPGDPMVRVPAFLKRLRVAIG